MTSAEVRQAVHDGPSTFDFIRIARGLADTTAEERALLLPFCDKRLGAWPTASRLAPDEWWRAAVAGAPPPGFSWARAAVAEGPELSAPALRQISILSTRGRIGEADMTAFLTAGRTAQLTALSLVDASLSDASLVALARHGFANLARLDVSGTKLAPAALVALARLPREALTVRRAGLGPEHAKRLSAVEQGCTITELDLSDSPLTDDGAAALAAWPRARTLTRLSLARCDIGQRGMRALARSGVLRDLDGLDVSDNDVVHEALEGSSLSDLRLAGTGLTERGFEAVAKIDSVRALDVSRNAIGHTVADLALGEDLEALHLSDTGLDARSVGALARLPLWHLDVSKNPLTTSAVAVLATAEPLKRLRVLDLSGTGLGDDGLSLLAQRESIVSLRIADDGITPKGLAAFLERAELPRLAEIDLSDNDLGDEGARRLAASKVVRRIVRIRVRNCGFTEEALTHLKECIPFGQIVGG